MSELGDILGDEFEEEYQQKRQQRREEANKVSKAVLMEICYEAINNDGFKGEEPRFRFSGENVDHDVLLMESPEDLDTFQWPLGDDAKTQGMFHLDQLFSLAFQENMLDLLNKIEPEEYYVVVGRYEERTEANSNGEEETYYNINPVRGIVPLKVAKKYADKYEEELNASSVEEQSQQQNNESSDTSESESDGSSSGIDLSGADEDDSVDESDVLQIFQAIGDREPALLEEVADGNEDMMDKLAAVVDDNVDGNADREFVLDVFEDNVESIPGRGEDEEDDDGLDLGGLGDSSDDESTDADSGSDESEADSTDDSDDGEDPSDWF